MIKDLLVLKPIEKLIEQADSKQNRLKRSLSATNLVMLGIGAIIGAGLFVRTAAAAAEHAGPAVVYSYVLAAIGCAFAGLCYAEFASAIPVAGSAYTYSYATLGEFFAWLIGWELILEYGLGAATVSIAWSEYLNKMLQSFFGVTIPYAWCHSPFEKAYDAAGNVVATGIMNVPAVGILLLLTLLLIRGTQQSALVNNIIVIIKVSIVLMFILLGWKFIKGQNHQPFIPPKSVFTDLDGTVQSFGGLWGILAGAGTVFFAYIGFDAVSTAAQEARNPRRDMPIGIIVSLAICTLLYILFSYVLTGIAPFTDFRSVGKEASVAYAIQTYMPGFGWLSDFITLAILAGFSSVILVMLLGQSRVFFSMSQDGLVPQIFSDIHPKFRTPYKGNLIFFVFTAVFAAFVPISLAGDLTSIGTLAAFTMVSAGVLVLRKRLPHIQGGFRTPWVPVVPMLGVVVCVAMMIGLERQTWQGFLIWTGLGLVVYILYGYRHSLARKNGTASNG